MANDVMNLPHIPEDPQHSLSPEQAGPAVLSLLRQAADVAKRNEDRAKILVQQLAGQVRSQQDRIEMLEADLRHYQERSEQAERWLLHIHGEIQKSLIEPMSGASAERLLGRRG